MLLPLLSGLRVGADAEAEAPPAPTPELSADLVRAVFAAINPDDDDEDDDSISASEAACRAVARWCALNRAHRDACRDANDDLWRALIERVFPLQGGFTPERRFRVLNRAHAEHRARRFDPAAARQQPELVNTNFVHDPDPNDYDNPRAYFYALCDAALHARMGRIWTALAEDFLYVTPAYPHYNQIAKMAMSGAYSFGKYPFYGRPDHPLKYVPTDRADYAELARLAVKHAYLISDREGDLYPHYALKHVPTDRADYGELARLSIESNPVSIQYVPTDRADYDELIRLAMRLPTPHEPDLLAAWQLFGHDSYDSDYDYATLAREVLKRDGTELRHLDLAFPPYRDAYEELALIAIEQSVNALKYVPHKMLNKYPSLRKAHEARWKGHRGARRGGARTGEACV